MYTLFTCANKSANQEATSLPYSPEAAFDWRVRPALSVLLLSSYLHMEIQLRRDCEPRMRKMKASWAPILPLVRSSFVMMNVECLLLHNFGLKLNTIDVFASGYNWLRSLIGPGKDARSLTNVCLARTGRAANVAVSSLQSWGWKQQAKLKFCIVLFRIMDSLLTITLIQVKLVFNPSCLGSTQISSISLN